MQSRFIGQCFVLTNPWTLGNASQEFCLWNLQSDAMMEYCSNWWAYKLCYFLYRWKFKRWNSPFLSKIDKNLHSIIVCRSTGIIFSITVLIQTIKSVDVLVQPFHQITMIEPEFYLIFQCVHKTFGSSLKFLNWNPSVMGWCNIQKYRYQKNIDNIDYSGLWDVV
jgi:hypothetical protein